MAFEFFKKLKRSVWGINLVGSSGLDGKNDLEFGMNDNDEPAIRLGEKIVTPDTIGGNKAFNSIKQVNEYLYEIDYDDYSHEDAEKYLKSGGNLKSLACTSVRKGNWYGRNYDWYYDYDCEFVVRTSHKENRKATIGVAGTIAGLTKDTVASGEYLPEYRILPFFIVDGINEDGLFGNINVVPTQKGDLTGTIPTEEKKAEICEIEIIRYILDNYSTAQEAAEDIAKHVSVYAYAPLKAGHYDVHALIGDKDSTYLLEFIENRVVVTEMKEEPEVGEIPPYMTNFHLSDIELNADGTVYTPSTQDDEHNAIDTNHITSLGSGLERYNLIVANYDTCDSKENMTNLMTNILKYTNSYDPDQDPVWYTEFVGARDLTVVSTPEEYAPVMDIVYDLFEHRSRDRGRETWQTVHASVYDTAEKKLYVHSQEEDTEYVFDFERYYTAAQVDEIALPKVTSEDNGKILKVVDGKWQVVDAN